MNKILLLTLTTLLAVGFSSLAWAPPSGCVTDAECDDGIFCNGTESCEISTGNCVAVSACPPSIDGCVYRNDSCDEDNDECVDFLNDGACVSGEELCAPNGDCLPYTAEVEDLCNEGNTGTDVDFFSIWCDFGICEVLVDMCDDLDEKAKYRVHFDTADPFFDDDDSDCLTTSDDTAMYRPGPDKLTGPEGFSFDIHDFKVLHWLFTYEELGITPGVRVAAWVDVHKKGIQDRAPNTFADDDCAKPQDFGEALDIWPGRLPD
jgi:hypothetical protein